MSINVNAMRALIDLCEAEAEADMPFQPSSDHASTDSTEVGDLHDRVE